MQVSLQIYSLREAGPLESRLALARRCGFDWIESVATHGLAPAAFAELLERHGLGLSSMHVALAELEAPGGLDPVVQTCRLTGCPLVVAPWLPMGERAATAAGWQALGRRLAALGEAFNAQGLRFAYHNHDWDLPVYEGRPALEWMFSVSTPAQVGWEADLGWVRRAGLEPLALARRHAERLVAVHCKDIAQPSTAVDEDGWCTLGRGLVGWGDLLPALRGLQPAPELFIFEHDRPVHVEATLRESRAFMREALGA